MSDIGQANALLEYISKHYISLNSDDMKKYGAEFRTVLNIIIDKMKEKDQKFKECFQKFFFAGSYWDGLKVGTPSEYDVDIVIKLPFVKEMVKIESSGNSAFVKVKVSSPSNKKSLKNHSTGSARPSNRKKKTSFRQKVNQTNHGKKLLESLVDEKGYLIQSKLRTWMESVVYQALDTFQKKDDSWVLNVENNSENVYWVKISKSGPAMTLYITLLDGFKIDVDLVPVIELKCSSYLPCYKKLQHYSKQHTTFFIVPKPNKQFPKITNCWRLAFHEQERVVFGTKEAGIMKPVCRLLKKLRDNLGLSQIASYYLKTLVMWEISRHEKNIQFFHKNMFLMFIHMLRILRDSLRSGRINYFWFEKYNLLEGYDCVTVRNWYGRIKRVSQIIENDPQAVASHLLNEEEYTSLPFYYKNMKYDSGL